ncbi:MAG: hypothetical protein MI810_04930 [Flavobacteriales bacterium]|jgi:ribulose bisphosphate carboxylase small subunit|nr:hypothetical protein [Flavobacteriales bacterium]
MSCEKVTYLIDKGELVKLSFMERMRIRMHVWMCKCCTHYEKDSKALGRMFRRLADKTEPKKVLSEMDKDKLKKAISEKS